MLNKNNIRTIVKLLALSFLVNLLFSSFAISKVSSVLAQEETPVTPTAVPPTPTEDVTGQIVGGTPADPGEWPWQVALINSAEANLWFGQFCGGVLASSEWVVTAAHCVYGQSAWQIDVVAGVYDLWNPTPGYQRLDVSQIIIHPSYNQITKNADIALLKLASPVTIGGSGETKTAILPMVSSSIGDLAGVNGWVTGWGTLSSGGYFPDQLYEVDVPIITNTLCNDTSHYNGLITSNMMCAGIPSGGKDACQGDSGGPLVIQSSGKWQLAGVVSGGNGCGLPKYPGVYTRVSKFTSWINSYVPRADSYENDNTPAQASLITSGSKQTHSIVPADDTDWVKFQLSSPSAVSLDTTGSTGSDTYMVLYDNNLTALKYDDDGGTDSFSSINTCLDSSPLLPAGTYYVKIDEFGNNNEIPSYQLAFYAGDTCIGVEVGGWHQKTYPLSSSTAVKDSYASVNNGPLRVFNSSGIDLISSERVVWGVGFDELMGYPANQLTNEYVFPWYNNKAMSSQLRIGNTGGVAADVDVYIGGEKVTSTPYTIGVGGSMRVEYTGKNNGPVRVVTTTPGASILATMRVIWGTGYDELMGFPADQLTNEYVFPWYNNKAMGSQLRIGNTGGVTADVDVYIGGVKVNSSPYTIGVGGSQRVSYTGLNAGLVRVVTTTPGASILATMRVVWGSGYDELMGYPADQLTNEYVFPLYSNSSLDTQLRIGNTGNAPVDVDVYIGGVKVNSSPYTIGMGGSQRVSYTGMESGPVRVVSTTPGASILVTERIIYGTTGYDEMMGYPADQLTSEYLFPWYNNKAMQSQITIGVP